MALNRKNFKKWFLMLTGRSVYHVKQTVGSFFVPGLLGGYFNSMIEKVTKQPEYLRKGLFPSYKDSRGEDFIFPVSVIQYGLGCYDLFLKTGETIYFDKFVECANWTLLKQNEDGSIPNFTDVHPEEPFGAMCQGEAASLFVRAYKETNNVHYLEKAETALRFMLKSVDEGGTSLYEEDCIILLEFTYHKPVLNGWIFAFFGVYDYLLVKENHDFRTIYNTLLLSIAKK